MYRVLCYSEVQRKKIKAACPTLLGGAQTEASIVTQYCVPFSQSSGTCAGDAYEFLDDAPFTPDGFLPRWVPDVETLRKGMPCLVNSLAKIFTPVRLYSLAGTVPPSEDLYLEAMQCSQVRVLSRKMLNAVTSDDD